MPCVSNGFLRFTVCVHVALASMLIAPFTISSPAYALSELKQQPDAAPEPEDGPAAQQQAPEPEEIEGDSDGIPLPDPLIDRSANAQAGDTQPADVPQVSDIQHDPSKAPEPVQRLRRLIIEAAASGDIEKLRPLVNPGPNQARVDGDGSEDPIAALKSFSGDPEGLEVLAIILDLLSTGYAHMDKGTPEEVYVWPYFAGKALNTLTATEKVELLRIITAGDLADMQEYGNYSFYRIGITPDGQWKFFTAGD